MKDAFQLSIARTASEIDALRPAWDAVQAQPNTDFDHYKLVLSADATDREPYVAVLRQDDEVRALAVGRIEPVQASVRLGYASIRLGRMRTLSIMTGGLLGPWTEAQVAAAVDGIAMDLRAGRFAAVRFLNLPSEGIWARAVQARWGGWRPRVWTAARPHWLLQLPDNPDAFWKKLSSKHRYWIKRVRRHLEEAYPGGVEFLKRGEPAHVEAFGREVESVVAATYQRGLGVGFKPDAFHVQRCALFASKGEFAGYLLRLGGKPAAFWMGCVRGGTFYSEFTGYDPALRAQEPGTALLAFILEDLIRAGVGRVDFGQGDALYKQRFGDTCWHERDVVLYRPSARGYLAAALGRLSTFLGACAASSRWGGKVKRWLRDRAAASQVKNDPATQGDERSS